MSGVDSSTSASRVPDPRPPPELPARLEPGEIARERHDIVGVAASSFTLGTLSA